jgi:hypothetical protein
MKRLYLFGLAFLVAVAPSVFGQQPGGDPLSGTWVGDWGPSASDRNQVTVELTRKGDFKITKK